MDTELQTMLRELSVLIQDVGRRVGSPKNDPDDLTVFGKALREIIEALDSVKEEMIDSYK